MVAYKSRESRFESRFESSFENGFENGFDNDAIESEASVAVELDTQAKINSEYWEQLLNFGFQLLIIFLISASVFPALRWAENQMTLIHLSQLNK